MKILFINGSPNKEGNTKKLADALLSGKEYEYTAMARIMKTMNLVL